MMKNNKLFIGFLAVVFVLTAGVSLLGNKVTAEGDARYTVNEIKDILGLIPFLGNMVSEPVNEEPAISLGAVVGPDIYNPYMSFNGITSWYNKIGLQTSTSTICAIKSPTSATSTLVYASLHLTTSSTTASIVDMAKATTAFATTTKIGSTHSIAAGAQDTIVASTTPTGGTLIFAPGQWFVVNMVAGPGKTVSPVGKCIAEFKQVD